MQAKKALKYFFLWPLLALLALGIILRLSLLPLTELGVNYWFEQQGIESDIAEMTLNLRDGQFSLSGLKAEANASPVLQIDHIDIEWSWQTLMQNEVDLLSISIDGVTFDIDTETDGNMVIAGIDLAKLSAANEQDAEPLDLGEDSPLQWLIRLHQFRLSDVNVCYRALPALDYCNQFKRLDWNGLVSLNLADLDTSALPLRVEGDFALNGVKLHNNQLDRSLLKLDNLAIKAMRIDTLDNISSESILLEKLQLLERRAKATPAEMTSLERLQVSKFKLSGLNYIEISEISLLNHELLLATGADKKMEWNEWFADNTTTDKSSDTETTTEQPSDPVEFAVGKLTYQTNKSILYRDNSTDQPLIIDINNIELVLQNLDSKKPGQDSDIEFSGKLGKNGLVTLKGTAKLLQEKVSFDLTGKITTVDLRSFSPLAHEAIGHTIKTGQLNADIKLRADNNILDSDIDLTLYQFNLEAESNEAREKVDAQFGFPLNTSLSLIKDKNGTITLNNSVTGDLDSPDFDPTLIVVQAVTTGITEAVLSFYTGFGLISLDDGKLSLGASLNFKPIAFEPGNGEMTPEGIADLDKIAELMSERPSVYVTLCAYTNTMDRILVVAGTSKIGAEDIELDEDQLAKLDELGKLREATIRNYLVEKKITTGRLIQCKAEHAEGEGLSGIDISI